MTSSHGSFFALLALCGGNSPVTGEFPITKGQWCFFDAGPYKLLNKQSSDRWFGTKWHSCDVIVTFMSYNMIKRHGPVNKVIADGLVPILVPDCQQ